MTLRSDVAALYVDPRGPYPKLVEHWWDEKRDARTYAGPWPVVAHPPCARWGRYWFGGPSAKVRRILGDDGGCFESALLAVRTYGGVLEHPEASHAWRRFDLNAPPREGGWIAGDMLGGWTCCVEQGHYGHRAPKPTWLYAFGLPTLPNLIWGPSARERGLIDAGYHSAAERAAARAAGTLRGGGRMSKTERALTPAAFAEWLLELAAGARKTADERAELEGMGL